VRRPHVHDEIRKKTQKIKKKKKKNKRKTKKIVK